MMVEPVPTMPEMVPAMRPTMRTNRKPKAVYVSKNRLKVSVSLAGFVIARSEATSNPELHVWPGLLRGACHRAALCADPLARNDVSMIHRSRGGFRLSFASLVTP